MKELDDFTVERLQEIETRARVSIALLNGDEVAALARIALAAKTAETVDISFIEGMEVSIDVSTCDADAGHRYFGTVSEVSELDSAEKGYILLVKDAKPNYPVLPDGWILLAEQKPEVGDEVIIGASDGSLDVATWCGDHFDDGDFFDHITWATHWKPAPTPPTTEK